MFLVISSSSWTHSKQSFGVTHYSLRSLRFIPNIWSITGPLSFRKSNVMRSSYKANPNKRVITSTKIQWTFCESLNTYFYTLESGSCASGSGRKGNGNRRKSFGKTTWDHGRTTEKSRRIRRQEGKSKVLAEVSSKGVRDASTALIVLYAAFW